MISHATTVDELTNTSSSKFWNFTKGIIIKHTFREIYNNTFQTTLQYTIIQRILLQPYNHLISDIYKSKLK